MASDSMALKVRTAYREEFWRCGIKFGKEPQIVSAKTCSKPSREATKKIKVPTIGEVLTAEPMLICESVNEPKETGEEPVKK